MDIISLLPEEVSHYVLEFLAVEDLGRCLRVCKRWRELANRDFLWKKHCLKFGVAEPTDNDISEFQDSSYWVSMWRSFGCSPAYKWHTNNYETLQFNKSRSYYSSFTSYQTYFIAYSSMYNCLDVYSVVKCDKWKYIGSKAKLITCLALCFPKTNDRVEVSIFMTDDYLITGKFNIILIYEKNNNNYDLIKAIKLSSLGQQFATRDIVHFVEQNFIPNYYPEIFGIIENSLFISVDETSYVLNIHTHEVRNIICYDTCIIVNNFFVTWTHFDLDEILRLYDSNGTNIVYLDRIPCIEEVNVNNTLICVQKGDIERADLGTESHIDVWDLASGRVQFHTETTLNTWSKLHPTKEILYTLEASLKDGIYQMTAWDIRTGQKLWIFNDDTPCSPFCEIVTHWNLHVVCENYLIVWPLSCGTCQYACIDARNGKCLYKGSRLTRTHELNYITDAFWLAISGTTYETRLRSYL